MSCNYSRPTRDKEYKQIWECRLTGEKCRLVTPDSVVCANKFNMGPDSYKDREQSCVNKVIDEIISGDF